MVLTYSDGRKAAFKNFTAVLTAFKKKPLTKKDVLSVNRRESFNWSKVKIKMGEVEPLIYLFLNSQLIH